MTIVLSLFFVFSVALKASNGQNWLRKPIVGGQDVLINEYPYQALVFQNGYICGGSIIGDQYILTAAHCGRDTNVDKFRVRIGSTTFKAGGKEYQVSEKFYHPQFNDTINDYDVAVLKTSQKMYIDGKLTRVVDLPDAGTCGRTGELIAVSGWGRVEESGSPSYSLQAVTVDILPRDQCYRSFENTDSEFTDRMFCAGSEEGRDACNGDSGGPAVLENDNVQYGIVSWGRGCGRKQYPGVYTCVPVVRDWIKKVSTI